MNKIVHPADTPAEVYRFWHRRWCELLAEHHRQAFLDAGLAGSSFTERVPDAPDGQPYFSYRVGEDGSVTFIEAQGEAIAEYDNYELGFRMLSDEHVDGATEIAAGRFRILTQPEKWATLMSLLPILRQSCRTAIEEAERIFEIELPKYW